MVQYNESKKLYEWYPTVVTFNEAGEDRTIYVTNASAFEHLKEREDVTNYKIATVIPTAEQLVRFNDLNTLPNKEVLAGWTGDVGIFVEFGYINLKSTDVHLPLRKKYAKDGTAYLIAKYGKLLSSYKKAKLVEGITVNDLEIDTSADSVAAMNAVYIGFISGGISDTDFKTKNGWKACNKEEFTKIVQAVHKHIRDSFRAELNCRKLIESKSLEELELIAPDYLPSGSEGRADGQINRLLKLYEREFAKLATPDSVVDNVMDEPAPEPVFRGVDNDGVELPTEEFKANAKAAKNS